MIGPGPWRGPAAGIGLGWVLLIGCGGSEPEPVPPAAPAPAAQAPAPPAPAPEPCLPDYDFAPPGRALRSPASVPLSDEVQQARAALAAVVRAHARDPANPWAVVHGILALGPELELTNGRDAVDWLFEEYAVAEGAGLAFPSRRGVIRIEPHTDLILKGLTEAGLAPDRPVTVQGKPRTLGELHRQSLCGAWVDGARISYGSFNDSPWALQGLSAWAPADLAWQTAGHPMTLDGFTDAVVETLRRETAFLREAMSRGERVEKRRQGIFAYTCGGAHLLQGAAHAVARGFGEPSQREALRDEVEVLFWRLDLELSIVDEAVARHPEYGLQLIGQRLKFLGHFLESAHKMAAMELYEPSPAQTAALDRALSQLVTTVAMLEAAGVWEQLDRIRQSDEQLYLDYVGDAAHAIRGIDLATGVGVVHL